MNMSAYRIAMASMEFDKSFETNTLLRLYSKLQKRRERKTALVRCGIGFAACAAVVVTVFSVRKVEVQQTPPVAIASPTATSSVSKAVETPTAMSDPRVIVASSKYGAGEADYMSPEQGKAGIALGVMKALDDPTNGDSYFFVQIDIIPPEQYVHSFDEYVYSGRSIAMWHELIDLANGEYPYRQYNGDHGGHVSKEQWEAAQAEAKTLNAQRNYDAAVEEYNTVIAPKLVSAKKTCADSELERLKQLGYDAFFMDTWSYKSMSVKETERILAGLLSAEQLRHFAAGTQCGTFIDWVYNGNGIVDWDESLRP